MKKYIVSYRKKLYLIVTILITVISIFSINTQSINAADSDPSVTISKKTLYTGYKTYKIKFKNLSKDAEISYKSSDSEIARISSKGKISPVAPGKATMSIMISQNGKEYLSKMTVTVKKPYIKLVGIQDVIAVNKSYELNANTYGLKKYELEYSVVNSDDKDDVMAYVYPDTLTLEAHRMGNITLTVTDLISGISVSKDIKVVADIDEDEKLIRFTDKESYILFGYYPQTEIKGKALTDSIKKADFNNETNIAEIDDIKIMRLSKDRVFSTDNGKWYDNYRYFKCEPIRWKVLNRSSKELVLISEYALTARQYDKKEKGVVWKDSYIRAWLNGYDQGKNMDYSVKSAFVNAAFTEAERDLINTKKVDGVKDRVHLLSYEEAKKTSYGFVSNADKSSSRVCYITEFAGASGARGSATEGTWWWLRSTANTVSVIGDGGAMAVYGGGKIETGGLKNGLTDNGVRPVISIDLSKLPKQGK